MRAENFPGEYPGQGITLEEVPIIQDAGIPEEEAVEEIAQDFTIPSQEGVGRTYGEYTETVRKLLEALPEAREEGYLFQERSPRNKGEQVLAELELAKDAFEGEAERCAQQRDPNGERVMRMWVQLKEAQGQVLRIYLDARNVSEEFAELIAEDNPWILGLVTEKTLPEIEIEA